LPKTYNDLYMEARRALRDVGVEAASLEARLLAAHASGKTTDDFMRDSVLYATDETEKALRGLMARRLKGEPIAYITRAWEFYGLPFEVGPEVLIPRVDTEVLAEQVINAIIPGSRARILDLCAGSGCIGCAIAHNVRDARVVFADVSRKAADVMKRNIAALGLNERCSVELLDLRDPPPASIGSFNIVVCNPPYIKHADLKKLDVSVKDYEPALALDGGADGLDYYRAVLSGWKNVIRDGGSLYFEVGAGMAEDVRKLMRMHGLRSIDSFVDTLGIERVISGKV